MIRSLRFALFLSILISAALLGPALADCSETDMSAVILISGIHPLDMSMDVLSVTPLGEVTYPDLATINGNLQAVMPTVPPLYYQAGTYGNVGLFRVDPADFGAAALVDLRDGQVLFGGTVVWAGQGQVVVPAASTHDWFLRPYPAVGPGFLYIIPSPWPDDEEIDLYVDQALDMVLATDVLHSFGECGEYSVVAYFYTPTVGMLDPDVVQMVLVVQGSCGPPWNGEPVANEACSWSEVKGLFRP